MSSDPDPASSDPLQCFCAHGRIEIQTRPDGPLSHLTFAVKDSLDVAGLPTGFGCPAWLATHGVPTVSAIAVQRLLDAGARFAGKTLCDEMTWSITGLNAHYGAPINPAAPDRITGGSSSGSASATAGGAADFALGSDTGGSIRIPASFCGLYGLRPTHGRIPVRGAVPLAPSYDTVGWFARDAEVFARVGSALLDAAEPAPPVATVLIARDLFALAGERVEAALRSGLGLVEEHFGPARPIDLLDGDVSAWREAFRIVQASEAWAAHGAWVEAAKPEFGPGVRERFEAASRLSPAEVEPALIRRSAIRNRVRSVLKPGTILLLPSAPGIAPLRTSSEAGLEAFRRSAMGLLCAAGHAGVPQISLPLATLDACPIGLGAMAWADGDGALLDLARRVGGV